MTTKTYYVFMLTGHRTLTINAEVANYIYDTVNEAWTGSEIALRLWEKANPFLHNSKFDRASLRECLRIATGREDYHKILHHVHYHRNINDKERIFDFATSIKRAIDNRAFRVIVK